MVELTDIIEKIDRCINNLNDICDEMADGNFIAGKIYADKLNAKKEEIEAVNRVLVEITECQE